MSTLFKFAVMLIVVPHIAIAQIRVIDGDTFELKNPNPPKELLQNKHRVVGIDTPESKKQFAKCEKEIAHGLKAKEFTQKFISTKSEIVYFGLDKYGRYLVAVKNGDKDLSEELVKNGLAVFYDGGTKIKDWCQ